MSRRSLNAIKNEAISMLQLDLLDLGFLDDIFYQTPIFFTQVDMGYKYIKKIE